MPDDTPYAPSGGHHVPPVRIPTPVPASVPTPPPGSLNAIGHLPTPAPGTLSYGSMPPQPRAGSIPPTNPAQAIPSTAQRRAPTPPPVAMSSPSLSMPAAPRRGGALIAFVVIADLGLAGAGALMLVKGLHKAKPDAKPAQKSEAAVPAPTPVAVAPAATAAPAPAPAEPAATPGSAAEARKDPGPAAARDHKDPKHHAAADPKKPGSGGALAPLDPYGGTPAPDLSQDIERAAAGSVGSFRSCLASAIETQPIHGQVRIAFSIEPDGHVDHTQAVVNTTGSDPLATCLSATIATWTFAAHPGPAASFERPFNYP